MNMKIFSMLVILASFPSIATAIVSLDISGYNSQDSMSVSLDGQCVDYHGSFYMDSEDMMYSNSGKSTEPQCFYDLTIAFNENTATTSATTDSGGFLWTAKMINHAGDINDPVQIFGLKSSHVVANGNLYSNCGNGQIKTSEKVSTNDAAYMESISIRSNEINVKGMGSTSLKQLEILDQEPITIEPEFTNAYISLSSNFNYLEKGPGDLPEAVPADGPEIGESLDEDASGTKSSYNLLDMTEEIPLEGPGFLQQVNVQSHNGLSSIGAIVTGSLVSNWKFGLSSGLDGLNFGMNAEGASIEGARQLEMQAQGYSIPLQRFPPGEVEIDVMTSTELELSRCKEIAENANNEFYEEYPSGDIRPSSWYYLDQVASIHPVEEESTTEEFATNSAEYFQMIMGFVVKGPD